MLGKKKKIKNKFQFTTDFQEQILNYTINDLNGYKALINYEDYYFDLIEHQVIAAGLKSFFKAKNRIPKNPTIFKQHLKTLYTHRDIKSSISQDDISSIQTTVDKLYKSKLQDGSDILEGCLKFASYLKFKDTIEKVDLANYAEYNKAVENLNKAIRLGNTENENEGTFLIRDIAKRQVERAIHTTVFPFPFWQLNKLTNAGGYGKASLFVLMDKAKGFKTAILINLMRGYMRLRKKVIVFDLENGEDSVSMRFEQSLAKVDKKTLITGDVDKKVQKILRKYRRFGVEVVIKRLPAYSTALDLKTWLQYYKREHNMAFQIMFIDGVSLMGSPNAKIGDDNGRIGNAYLDVKNLAEEEGIEHVWTPHHINRPAYPRRATKYEATDTSKCIDVHRHVDGMFGVQQDDNEKAQGVYRIEVIDQRDGPPSGAIMLWSNEPQQRVMEFSRSEVEDYKELINSQNETDETEASEKAHTAQKKKTKGDI